MKNIELVLEFGESLDQSGIAIIKTDHVRLGQIMTNLISNAIRFTAPSSVRRITMRLDVSFSPPMPETCAAPPVGMPLSSETEDTPVWMFVAVSDTGPGLTPEECAVLFQQFSRE
jgi:signal transduction histidine kinase